MADTISKAKNIEDLIERISVSPDAAAHDVIDALREVIEERYNYPRKLEEIYLDYQKAESERQLAVNEVGTLKSLVAELADDLESEIAERHGLVRSPAAFARKIEREMGTVLRARDIAGIMIESSE